MLNLLSPIGMLWKLWKWVDAQTSRVSKPIELELSWLPIPKRYGGSSVRAITLWPLILYRTGSKTTCVQQHEHYHWYQIKQWGVIPWYMAYVLLYLNMRTRDRYIYKAWEHPLETAAYELEQRCNAQLQTLTGDSASR